MFLELNVLRPLKRQLHIFQSVAGGLMNGNASKKLKLIGVTGTSGKSTTSTMIYNMLKHNGYKVGLISTVEAIAGNESFDTGFHVTSPDPIDLQKLLKRMQEKGMEYIVVEASSHALEQGRFGLLKFDFAVYTNIKRDHLDWHITWENYAKAKSRLMDHLTSNGVAVINKDDIDSYNYLSKKANRESIKTVSYSFANETKNPKETQNGISFEYKLVNFNISVLGLYNIENALAAIKIGEQLSIKTEDIAKSFLSFNGVAGRMQIMQKEPFMVIVDFAHNTDSLVRSLEAARKLVKDGGKLITVFGSAGLRDVEKRFTMGEASGRLADITIVTAEDPRTESLYDINSRIISGAEKSGAKLIKRFKDHNEYLQLVAGSLQLAARSVYAFDYEEVENRFDAIEFALMIAKPGDIIITEGKGHEKSLCFGTVEYPFTDQEAVMKAREGKRFD